MKRLVSHRGALGLLCAATLLLSLPGLWVPYYNIDELTNAVYGRFLVAGDLGIGDFLGSAYFLTHYFYAALEKFFGTGTLVPLHVFHAAWKCLTVLALYWAGSLLSDRPSGLWSAAFYTFASVSFLSKDFHTPGAESFSLLPAALSAGSLFLGMNRERVLPYFLAGVCAAAAALFKAPMGITALAATIVIAVRFKGLLRNLAAYHAGFAFVFIAPVLAFGDPAEGLRLMLAKLEETGTYVEAYAGLSYLYWILKFLIRTGLVLAACFAVTCFAFQTFRILSHLKRKHRGYWQKILFLWLWLAGLAYAVSLGGRVFFHYYVFLLAPLCLLGGCGLKTFDARLLAWEKTRAGADARFSFLRFVRRHVFVLLLLPAAGFSVEGALNFSTRPPDVARTVDYIKSHTAPADRIYVWGNVPQLYYFSRRQPSTPYFWSDILAGTSPGSPAMEYVRATGKTLTLTEQLRKDFQPDVFAKSPLRELDAANTLSTIGENELFTLDEILVRIDHPYWRKVFADFFKNPPELFIDTSPTNIRGFGHTPIEKYELLKRFVLDNYRVETVVDRMVIYRLRSE